MLHHTGWDTTRERGSTALRAAADTVIKCERIGAGALRITNTPPGGKQRDAEELPTMQLRTVPRGESLTVEHVVTFTSEQTQRERDLELVVGAAQRTWRQSAVAAARSTVQLARQRLDHVRRAFMHPKPDAPTSPQPKPTCPERSTSSTTPPAPAGEPDRAYRAAVADRL